MAHRGHNEGSIYKRQVRDKATGALLDERWVAQITVEPGKRRSHYGRTRQEVQKWLTKALRDREQGVALVEERQTVAQFLADWLETVRPPKLVAETWSRYEDNIRLHIIPEIGRVKLAALTPQQVQRVYAAVSAKGLSTSSVRHVHAVLHRALESALRLGLVVRNVSDVVEKPRRRTVEMHPLNREQARAYLAAADGNRLEAFFVLALATGMRLGELLALKWADLDLERHTVRVIATLKWRPEERAFVFTQPKTSKSRRQISISAPVVAALLHHKTRQKRERMAAGEAWQEGGLVFCDEIGRPLMDYSVRRRHWALCKAAGLPKIRPHDLRHTCATLLLSQRVNPKVVSEMLGHSSVSITLDIYSHVLPDMQQDAAAAMAVALGW